MVVMAADDYGCCAPALSVSSCNSGKAKVKNGAHHVFRGWMMTEQCSNSLGKLCIPKVWEGKYNLIRKVRLSEKI